jgi:plastocyanin
MARPKLMGIDDVKTEYLSFAIIAVVASLVSGPWLNDSAAVAADTSASASLSGVVKFEGVAPKPTRIDMSSDPNCLKAHPAPATTEDMVTGTNSGLENAVVFVSDGLEGRTFQLPAEPAILEQKGCTYTPHVIALQTNQKLKVVNSDSTTHNIHPTPVNNREWNMSQPPGVPIEQTFAREEIAIPVKCNVHPWMRGYIAVFKHPYFAVTGKDGSFELKDLPGGTYTITVWHGKLGTQSQKVTVGVGQTQKLEFIFK